MKRSPVSTYLAIDLGAGSGRAVIGRLRDRHLVLKEVYRFPNAPCDLGGTLCWNFLSIWEHIQASLRECARAGCPKLDGIGVDTWGVDFGLLSPDGRLLDNPVCYRDPAVNGIEAIVASAIAPERLYRLTGLSPGPITTLSQLCARRARGVGDALACAGTLLMMPDLIRYFLCGHKGIERTSAGSSQLTNVRTGKWALDVFRALDLPRQAIPDIVQPGSVVGALSAELAKQAGLQSAPVIAVAGHDTPSAAAAAPYAGDDCAFVSCGTWAVLGVIRDTPITTLLAMKKGFVNELGVEGVLLCRNMMGLYLFENFCRASSEHGRSLSYASIIKEASAAKPFAARLDLNAPEFFVTENPAESIRAYLRQTGQKPVRGRGAVARLLLEGVASNLSQAARDLQTLTARPLKRICFTGGGSRNKLLCRMTAQATGIEVIAGPAEATVIGNIGMQALATGRLRSPDEIRDMTRRSNRLCTH